MKKEAKPLKDLNLTSRFLFDEVMEDAETLGCALSIIFGREVPLLLHPETEKELRVSPLLRSEDTTDKAAEETGSEHIKSVSMKGCER